MKEFIQAGDFFDTLEPEEKEELCKTLAEDIYFLDDLLQRQLLAFFAQIHPQLADTIRERNSFTR